MKLYGSEKIFDLELINGEKVKALGFWGKESVFLIFILVILNLVIVMKIE